MTLTIDLSSEQEATLKAEAMAQGLTFEDWVQKLLVKQSDARSAKKPKKSAYGLLAEYGPGPTEEEIDENRREMFRGFAEDAP